MSLQVPGNFGMENLIVLNYEEFIESNQMPAHHQQQIHKLSPAESTEQENSLETHQNIKSSYIVNHIPSDEYALPTPLEAIQDLYSLGYLIRSDVLKSMDEIQGTNKWRVSFSCGRIKVQCESGLKLLAKEAGASMFLKELHQSNILASTPVSHSKIPEACFYDPNVENKVQQQVKELGHKDFNILTESTMKNKRPFFTSKLSFANYSFSSSSYNLTYAKTLSAKSAYEFITKQKLKKHEYTIVPNNETNANYMLTETLAMHTTTTTPVTPILIPPTRRLPCVCRKRRMEVVVMDSPDSLLEDLPFDPERNFYT